MEPESILHSLSRLCGSIWLCRVLVEVCEIFCWQRANSAVARVLQFPDQGWSPGCPHWGCGVLAIGPGGKSPRVPGFHQGSL